MKSLKKIRSVLVSGCSGEFGFRAARALAERGHRVIAGIREPEGRGRERRDALLQLSADRHLRCVALDVDDDLCVAAAVQSAQAWLGGPIDTLVNTAGYSVMGPLEACQPDQLLAMLNTNVVGALRLFRSVLPGMRAAGEGRIIQVTSGLGRAALPFMGIYSASAWAQECFAEVLSYEAAAFGIEVGILEPSGYRHGGQPKKPVGDDYRLAAYESQLLAFAERVQTEGEGGDPEELASAIVESVEAERLPLRRAVGADAEQLLKLRESLSGADYQREILERAGLSQS